MTSIGPYNQPTDFTHMYAIPDLRGPLPLETYNSNSVMGVIQGDKNLSKFAYIIKRAKLDWFLNSYENRYTVFAVTNDSLSKHLPESFFQTLDIDTARTIALSCMFDRQVPYEILSQSTSSLYPTKFMSSKILVTNSNGKTYINKCITIEKSNIMCDNGIIHIVSKLIEPYDC